MTLPCLGCIGLHLELAAPERVITRSRAVSSADDTGLLS